MKLINIGDSFVSEGIFNMIYDFGECLHGANTIILRELHYSLQPVFVLVSKLENVTSTVNNNLGHNVKR